MTPALVDCVNCETTTDGTFTCECCGRPLCIRCSDELGGTCAGFRRPAGVPLCVHERREAVVVGESLARDETAVALVDVDGDPDHYHLPDRHGPWCVDVDDRELSRATFALVATLDLDPCPDCLDAVLNGVTVR